MNEKLLSPDVSQRICNHMNNDHKEAVIGYARHYGGKTRATTAKMLSITQKTMTLEVDGIEVEIQFDHTLSDSEDAHKTLIAMLKGIPKKDLIT